MGTICHKEEVECVDTWEELFAACEDDEDMPMTNTNRPVRVTLLHCWLG